MDPLRLVSIGCRIFSMWLLWNAVQTALLGYAVNGGVTATTLVSFAIAAVYLAAGLVIWLGAARIARWIAGSPAADAHAGLSEHGALVVALVAVGLWCLAVEGLGDFGDYASTFAMLAVSGQYGQLSSAAVNVTGIVALVKMAVGLLLVTRASTLARRIGKPPSGTVGQR